MQIKLTGDSDITEGSGRIMCFNPMEQKTDDDGNTRVWFCGLWYLDEYVKVDNQWKMRKRVEEKSGFFNN